MINPKELRSGNYVHKKDARYNGKEVVITDRLYQITGSDIYHIEEDGDPTNHPIPLTVDWIAKCGFKWDTERQVYYIQVGNMLYLEYDTDFNCSVVPETWRGQPLPVWGDNKYLHKLQNIYFDHTGEEIAIKL